MEDKTKKIDVLFSKIVSIENFFKNKNDTSSQKTKDKNEQEINTNIYIKYLKNPDIIFQNNDFNNENLKLLFNELKTDIENGTNIIFPFLDIVPNLIKAYIESDLDDTINIKEKNISSIIDQSIYLKVFEKLKNNCFISKEILFPIYDYFKKLYDIGNESNKLKTEDELVIKKFNKVVGLFEIFYEQKINKDSSSSICFIGGSIYVEFNIEFYLSNIYTIDIDIKILNSDYIQYLNDDLNLIKINDGGIIYKDMKKNLDRQKLKTIKISINSDYINIIFETETNNFNIKENIECTSVRDILLLENFYGQISSIELRISEKKNEKKFFFRPNSILNGNTIFYQEINEQNNINMIEDIIPSIKINNNKLVNINYINYNNEKFDIINYFGGIIQFLPFYQILKNLKEITKDKSNKFIGLINVMNYFFTCILNIIIKKLLLIQKKKKFLEKYICFIYYLCLDLDLDLLILPDEFEELKTKENEDFLNKIEFLIIFFYNQKNSSYDDKNEIKEIIKHINTKKINLDFFKKPKKTLKQLYTEYMKSLFCFNNFWSKRNIFFPKRYNNINNINDIKYKQLNYYTKNFQLPFFYPLLEYHNYYPKFSNFKGNLFKDKEKIILEYNFELKVSGKAKAIVEELLKDSISSKSYLSEKCCLVKNRHHVIGKLCYDQNNYIKSKDFSLIFMNIKKEKKEEYHNCNNNFLNKNEKTNIEKAANEEQDKIKSNKFIDSNPYNLCFGAIFPSPEKEYKRNIIIKSKNILFVIIRVYFKKLSAIEIFTINKSYYFNFQNALEINNLKSNKIINLFINNSSFKEIHLKDNKLILGYYNIKYKPYLFPLFEDEINFWDKKVKYFCNYDIISLVNLFSNRSFRDVFQYPVFPTLYNLIDLERDMSKHIGIQEISNESKKRKELIFKNYHCCLDDNEKNEEIFLFNIHYSNPAFVFNYLLRIFPYTFLSIEFQGDYFDNPNRLFFSIESTLKSSLNILSDVREMIPELYYMIEIFYNKNDILFDKLNDGRKIDEVYIFDNEKLETHMKKLENYAEFLYKMRNYLDNNKNINKWIDLIFGINQKFYISDESHKYPYYEQCSEVVFQNTIKEENSQMEMDKISFGLLPYKLFNKNNFSRIPDKNDQILNELKNLNKELFEDEHTKINRPEITFLCKGRIFIDENYIKIIEPNAKLNILGNYYNIPNNISKNENLSFLNNHFLKEKFDFLERESNNISQYENKMNLISYYFLGDVFGNITVYALKEVNKNEKEEKKKDRIKIKFGLLKKSIIESKLIDIELIIILNHHIKEIKYIDFNQRLNILLSYSLDNFINIYIFPIFKLINVIDINSFKDEYDKNYFDEVVLLSFPFPSIICHNNEFIYMLSINGELIKYKKLEEGDEVRFYIDKNLGIFEDKVEILNSKGNIYSIFNYFKK